MSVSAEDCAEGVAELVFQLVPVENETNLQAVGLPDPLKPDCKPRAKFRADPATAAAQSFEPLSTKLCELDS